MKKWHLYLSRSRHFNNQKISVDHVIISVITFYLVDQTKFNWFLSPSNTIEGWFYPADMVAIDIMDEIQRHLGITGSICEVGVYKGKSLTFLSHLLGSGELLFGYDDFINDH